MSRQMARKFWPKISHVEWLNRYLWLTYTIWWIKPTEFCAHQFSFTNIWSNTQRYIRNYWIFFLPHDIDTTEHQRLTKNLRSTLFFRLSPRRDFSVLGSVVANSSGWVKRTRKAPGQGRNDWGKELSVGSNTIRGSNLPLWIFCSRQSFCCSCPLHSPFIFDQLWWHTEAFNWPLVIGHTLHLVHPLLPLTPAFHASFFLGVISLRPRLTNIDIPWHHINPPSSPYSNRR